MSRLVHIRGASGSGKTHLAREVMRHCGTPVRWKIGGRQKPIALTFPAVNLAVVGHYDVTCGGADTIKSKDKCCEVVDEALARGFNVLVEGIFLAVELHRTVELAARGVDRHDVFLDIPMADCIDSVQARRVADGKEPKELKQMEPFYRRIMRTRDRLIGAGIDPSTVHVFSAARDLMEGEPAWDSPIRGHFNCGGRYIMPPVPLTVDQARAAALAKTRELLNVA